MDRKMMKNIRCCLTVIVAYMLAVAADVCFAENGSFLSNNPRSTVCKDLVIPNGYPCQEFTVTTDDGYILTMQRIPHGKAPDNGNNYAKPPVLLGAGILQAGAQWVVNSPEQSLGFILADEGFDVWIANYRGATDSIGHVSLSVKDKRYWDWSFSEIASFDLPAFLRVVHTTTRSQVHYIGHSQGTIVGLAGLTDPNVRKMLKSASLLCPIAYLHHTKSKLLYLLAHSFFDKLVLMSKIGEFNLAAGREADALINVACRWINCGDVLTEVTGKNSWFNSSMSAFYVQFLQPTSIKNLAHLSQMVRYEEFKKYDMGAAQNLAKYHRATPPPYKISKIPESFPLFLAYGGFDNLADEEDVLGLIRNLRCKVKAMYMPSYGHLDFAIGTNAFKDVYPTVIDFLRSN